MPWTVYMAKINYAVRVTTDEALYNETYGMTETGVFAWITGNPGYTGLAINGATGEAGLTGMGTRWNEGWLTKEGMDNPTREIDLNIAGNYGTQSGFSFSLLDSKAGVGSQFRKFVSDNDIKFTGRKVEMFSVIDNIFYRTWSGKVANNPVDETAFQFTCDDTYKQIHKLLPPVAISQSTFPNAVSTGKYIPVCIGDVPYAECMQVAEDAARIPLAQSGDGREFESVPLYQSQLFTGAPAYLGWTGGGPLNPYNLICCYDLWTYGKVFETGCFEDGTYYLNVTHGTDPATDYLSASAYAGDFPDKTQLVPILSNSGTTTIASPPLQRSNYKTTIICKEPIHGHCEDRQVKGLPPPWWSKEVRLDDETLSSNDMYLLGDHKFFMSIVRLPTQYIVSMEEIHAFIPGEVSHIQLYAYNDSNKEWIDVSHNVKDFGTLTADGYQAFMAPHGLGGEELVPCGIDNYSALVPIQIPKIDLVYTAGYNNVYYPNSGMTLRNGKRNNYILSYLEIDQSKPKKLFEFDIIITDELRALIKDSGFDKLYLVPDFIFQPEGAETIFWPQCLYDITMYPMTIQGIRLTTSSTTYQNQTLYPSLSYFGVGFAKETIGGVEYYNHNYIPAKYWRMTGWDPPTQDTFFHKSYDSRWDSHYIGDTYVSPDRASAGTLSFLYREPWAIRFMNDIIDDSRIQRIRVKISGRDWGIPRDTMKFYVRWYQFALVGLKTIALENRGIYTRVAGEEHLNKETNTVYMAFRKMLEGYDGIPLADIDYGNLPWTRDTWHVGRQLTDQKSSFDYLQELAKQSFVGIAPKRDGKRLLSAWREDTADPLAHNSDSIVRNGMHSWEQTPLNQVFNEFTLKYNFDPGEQEYTRQIFVAKVDATAFPGITGAWGQYVGSNVVSEDESSISGELSGEDAYPDAKNMWDICHESYDRVKVLSNELDDSYCELPWYIDYSEFDYNDVLTHQGVDSSAWKYLRQLTQWTTRQKDIVTYDIPLTAANIQNTELLSPVSFSDPIWSAGTTREGWITRVTVNTQQDKITVSTILQPESIYLDSSEITPEVGSVNGAYLGDPLIVETGGADLLAETGVT